MSVKKAAITAALTSLYPTIGDFTRPEISPYSDKQKGDDQGDGGEGEEGEEGEDGESEGEGKGGEGTDGGWIPGQGGGGEDGEGDFSGPAGNNGAGIGDFEDATKDENGNPKTPSELKKQEQDWKQELADAAQNARMAGKFPNWLEAMVDELLEAKVDWREYLAQFIKQETQGKSDYIWTKPNRRYVASGLILPSINTDYSAKVVLIMDTSGSTWVKSIITQFVAELNDVVNEAHCSTDVMYADTIEHEEARQHFEPGDDIVVNVEGGGGTDFADAIQKATELEPDCIIYLTDGDTISWGETHLPVLWGFIGEKNRKPPYGEAVYIEIDGLNV